jgi:hypothetical protein
MVRLPAREEILSPNRSDRLLSSPTLLWVPGILSSDAKRSGPEADHSHLSVGEFKNEASATSHTVTPHSPRSTEAHLTVYNNLNRPTKYLGTKTDTQPKLTT